MAREGYRVSRPTLGTTKRPRCKVCMYCGEKAVWGSLCHAHYYVPVSCFGCERIFYLTPSKAIERLGRKFKSGPFCSRQCQGQWLGNQYGFGRES